MHIVGERNWELEDVPSKAAMEIISILQKGFTYLSTEGGGKKGEEKGLK